MDRTSDLSAEQYLAESAWLRRLARSLVDEATAEDVLQETFAAALAAPPGPDRPRAPWLATVLRNFARMASRGERRRRARELAVGETASEPLPTAEELLARHQAQRLVAEAVAGLEEPFRSTLLLCYGEGLAPSEIARRLDLVPGTVRWRLKRALELVRQRLDEGARGDRRAWALLLAPLAPRVGPKVAVTGLMAKGAILMKAKLAAGGVVLLLLLVLLLSVERRSRSGPDGPGAAPAGSTDHAGSRTTAAPAGAAPLPRLMPTPASTEQAGALARATLEGTVRDEQGKPIGGALVAAVPNVPLAELGSGRRPLGPAATTLTDSAGRYRMTGLPAEGYGVTGTAAGFDPGHRGGIALAPGSAARIDLVLARGGATLRGRVLDVGGGTVASARVMALSFTGAAPDTSQIFVALSDGEGRYALHLRRNGHYGFAAEADGYAQTRLATETVAGDRTLDIVLRPAAQISGRIVESTGTAVPGALVRLARQGTAVPFVVTGRSDARGEFVLRGVVPASYRLWARQGTRAGRHPTTLVVREAELITGIVLALEPRATLAGQVKSAAGQPVAGAELWFQKEEEVTAQERQAVTAGDGRYRIEGVLPGSYWLKAVAPGFSPRGRQVVVDAGDPGPADFVLAPEGRILGRVVTRDGRPAGLVRVLALIESAERPGNRRTHITRTLPDGTFRIDGLEAGELRLGAEDAHLGIVRASVWKVAAAQTIEPTLRLEPGATLSGRVRSSGARPAGAVVVTAFQGPPGAGLTTRSTRTAADGSFVLSALGNGPTRVLATAAELGAEPRELPAGAAATTVIMASGQDARNVELVLPAAP
jgi:RNA polymerase sigma factor (sigma-70 family)